MNDTDSKKLEEIETNTAAWLADPLDEYEGDPDTEWLISKVKEQNQEIERLREEAEKAENLLAEKEKV